METNRIDTREICRFIDHSRYLSLATVSNDKPWSAAVYFVRRDGRFYFFSSPEARHSGQIAVNPRAAATISSAGDGWEDIRGVQMSGRVRAVRSPAEKGSAIRSYLDKFPFVRTFIASQQFRSRMFSGELLDLHLFCFEAEEAFYQDNRLGFGRRYPIPPDFGFRSDADLPQ